MTASAQTPDVELELRRLAKRAAPATTAADDLATLVLRRVRTRRRRRYALIGAAGAVGLLASVAAVRVGGGPYFNVTQPSAAMAPTIAEGGSMIFNRDLRPRTGDIVYLSLSADGHTAPAISRMVGAAGDTVSCPANPDGSCDAVLVNGRRLNPYLDGLVTRPFATATVPPGHIFVLGDQRNLAYDSRVVGSLPLGTVEGVAVATEDHQGHLRAIPGAPRHAAPDDQHVIDPALPVPPASAQ